MASMGCAWFNVGCLGSRKRVAESQHNTVERRRLPKTSEYVLIVILVVSFVFRQ